MTGHEYFQAILDEARERFPISYMAVKINIGNGGEFTYGIHLKVEGGSEMAHIHDSKCSLKATIEECVRRCDFDNGHEPVGRSIQIEDGRMSPDGPFLPERSET